MTAKITKPEWPAKPCCVCGKPIPFYTRAGVMIKRWHYSERKTCGDECYGKMHANNRKLAEPLPEPTMMDKFILGVFTHDNH